MNTYYLNQSKEIKSEWEKKNGTPIFSVAKCRKRKVKAEKLEKPNENMGESKNGYENQEGELRNNQDLIDIVRIAEDSKEDLPFLGSDELGEWESHALWWQPLQESESVVTNLEKQDQGDLSQLNIRYGSCYNFLQKNNSLDEELPPLKLSLSWSCHYLLHMRQMNYLMRELEDEKQIAILSKNDEKNNKSKGNKNNGELKKPYENGIEKPQLNQESESPFKITEKQEEKLKEKKREKNKSYWASFFPSYWDNQGRIKQIKLDFLKELKSEYKKEFAGKDYSNERVNNRKQDILNNLAAKYEATGKLDIVTQGIFSRTRKIMNSLGYDPKIIKSQKCRRKGK